MSLKTVAERIADYVTSLEFKDLDPLLRKEISRRVVDSLATMYGAAYAEPVIVARKVAEKFRTVQGSSLLLSGQKVSPDMAAFANGVAVRYLDFNDTYLSKEALHPSDMIPGLIALGESVGASGKELVTSIVAAYEVALALADTVTLRDRGYDHVANIAFGASAGAAKLLDLDHQRTVQAVNIAGVNAAALRQTRAGELSMWKGCAAAYAARHGVFAAMLASEGMTGPSPIFEGEMGFWRVVAGTHPNVPPFGGQDGQSFRTLMTSIKRWPVEYHSMSAVEAAVELRKSIADVSEIKSIETFTFTVSYKIIVKDPEKWRPRTRETADHSLPYITARTLIDGDIWVDSYTDEKLNEPRVLELLAKTRVDVDPKYDEIYPSAVPNRVILKTSDGRTLSKEVIYPIGHYKNPMSESLLFEKFMRLVKPVIGAERSDQLFRTSTSVENIRSISELTEFYRK
ncbi:MAG: MmgE/PrpD family protein [Thaumarchaeota archaeon]|nr:MmgE/PrpD family protein [Candidatus Calditenuaceae archaeon]MDW8187455.1 MmgE/PrpD family protein [Nitrososphaerota archaeon]